MNMMKEGEKRIENSKKVKKIKKKNYFGKKKGKNQKGMKK